MKTQEYVQLTILHTRSDIAHVIIKLLPLDLPVIADLHSRAVGR
jgi:hypothetical protein